MSGLRPIAEIMFSDFVAVCWDGIVNEIAKARYMSGGQLQVPLVIRAHNGGGLGFGAQHSQSIENWLMAIPGLKVVAPSSPEDVVGLFETSIDDPDPVVFLEHKALLNIKGDVPDTPHRVPLGQAKTLREGSDLTVVALAAMVPVAVRAADALAEHGLSVEVLDLRTVAPLDVDAVMASVAKTCHLVVVEENPRPCGWGAEVASIIAERAFWSLDGPIVRIAGAAVPLAVAENLEHAAIPDTERVVTEVLRTRLQDSV